MFKLNTSSCRKRYFYYDNSTSRQLNMYSKSFVFIKEWTFDVIASEIGVLLFRVGYA